MNCKPGDIAYITHPSMVGKLVSVLYAAPADDFILPDGHKALRTSVDASWVCESLGSLFPVKNWEMGVCFPALRRYAVIGDQWLRPIRGDELPAEVSQPETVEA